jgi:predicted nucleic acid-binding protein
VDRLFLDANVLFSAAYRPGAGLLALWKLKNVRLCTSRYALEEARLNLSDEVQRARLQKLAARLELFDAPNEDLPSTVALPEKDAPILLAAMQARATHLLTGDVRHFGAYLSKKIAGKKVAGILIVLPGDDLRNRVEGRR